MTFSQTSRDILNPSRVGFNDGRYFKKASEYFTEGSIEDENCIIDLLKDLKKLYEDTREGKVGHDTIIKLTDGSEAEFPAHKQILTARSSLFEALFKSEEIEGFKIEFGDVTEIKLPSDFSQEVTEYLINYIYWGYIGVLEQEYFATDIFKKACLLDLKELRRSVGDVIHKSFLKESNALVILKLADECECKFLKKKAIDYIVDHKNEVTQDQKWISFAKDKKNSELIRDMYKNDALQITAAK